MSEPTPTDTAPERPTPSRWPLAALVITTMVGLGGTGYYFLYQKEEMASRRRQEASPLAYFEARERQQAMPEETEGTDTAEDSLPMPDEPVSVPSEETPPEAPQASESITETDIPAVQENDQLVAQEERIAALEARLDAMQQEMESLSAALAQLPARMEESAATEDRAALVAQFYRVRQQAMDARPFDESLAALLAMEGLDGETYATLGKLQGAAEEGVPSLKALQKDFARSFEEYLSRQRTDAPSQSLWRDMRGSLAGLVRVRKVGAQHAGDDDASILARAEAALSDGKLPDAVKEVAMLSPDAAAYFNEWRGEARQRLRVLATFERLERRLLPRP